MYPFNQFENHKVFVYLSTDLQDSVLVSLMTHSPEAFIEQVYNCVPCFEYISISFYSFAMGTCTMHVECTTSVCTQ